MTADQMKAMLARLKALPKGRRGRQLEPGFEIVENLPGHDPLRLVPVFLVLCKDATSPTPQYRFVSAHELFPADGSEPVLEVRDRIAGVRVRDPAGSVAHVVVGGTDDVAEVLVRSGMRWGLSLALPGLARLAGFAFRLPGILNAAAGGLVRRLGVEE